MSANIRDAKQKLPLPALLYHLGLAKLQRKAPGVRSTTIDTTHFRSGKGTWRFWRCYAGCGGGDEITFLEKHKRISRGEAIRVSLEMDWQRDNGANITTQIEQRAERGF